MTVSQSDQSAMFTWT